MVRNEAHADGWRIVSGVAFASLNGLRRRDTPIAYSFLDDGRICLTNNAPVRALRCVPLGRKDWLFCNSDRGGQRAAILLY